MKVVILLSVVLALTGCVAHKTASAEQVARSWSAALDRNDNEAAARLFAGDAKIVQAGELVLHTHGDAVRWNRALPCGGSIVSVTAQGKDQVLLVFTLAERPQHRCDGPGSKAAAIFRVKDGKITLWHQTAVPQQDTAGQAI